LKSFLRQSNNIAENQLLRFSQKLLDKFFVTIMISR
jgi:hypothetical protein